MCNVPYLMYPNATQPYAGAPMSKVFVLIQPCNK